MVIPGDFGFPKAAMMAAFGLDFLGLENEPGRQMFVRHALHFVQVPEGGSGLEFGLAGGGSCSRRFRAVDAISALVRKFGATRGLTQPLKSGVSKSVSDDTWTEPAPIVGLTCVKSQG